MNEIVFLIKLLCAHFLSDFILQTNKIQEGKKRGGSEGILYQLLHSIIHALVAYVLLLEWNNWQVPTVIFVSHFIIDFFKYKSKNKGLSVFLWDQVSHLGVILVMWFILYGNRLFVWQWIESVNTMKFWSIATIYVLMFKPSSVLLSLFLKQWTPDTPNAQSLPNAGQWIGYLERVLILTFVLRDNMEGVGFLLAAKSVFRFGELSKAKEIKTTEYVLIGTFSSFTIAVLVGIVAKYLGII